MSDDLRRRIAALRAAGKSNAEIATILQAERNAAKAGTRDTSGVGAMVRAPASESLASPGAGNLRGGTANRTGDFFANAARTAAQGVLMGGYDEVEGRARSLLPGRNYEDEVAKVRGGIQEFRQDSPKLATALELAGGFVPVTRVASGLVRGAKAVPGGLTLGKQVLRGMGAGAGLGAVSGALYADPQAGEDAVGRRIGGSIVGGLFGGGFGGAVPVAAKLAARPLSAVMQKIQDAAESAAKINASRVGAVGRGVGDGADEVLLGELAERGATAVPSKREAEALARQFFGKYGAEEKFALEVAMRRVERDGMDLADALASVAEVTDGGRPVVVADLGGRSTRRLVAGVEATPGSGSSRTGDFLEARMENRPDRLANDVIEGTGSRRINPVTRADEIAAARKPLTDDLYEAATAGGPKVALNEKGKAVLDTPESRRAYGRAVEAADEAGPVRGRRPLEPITETIEEFTEVPKARPGDIQEFRGPDGNRVFVGGNDKFGNVSTERLEALYAEQLERIERGTKMEAEGINPWSRFDPNADAQRSGIAPKNEYGRGINLGNVAERQAREIEAELVGRYRMFDPTDLEGRPGYAFKSTGGPIWTEMADDLADELGDAAEPEMMRVVTGTKEQVKDEIDLATLDAWKKKIDRRISKEEADIAKGAGDPDLLASLVANRDEVVTLMEQQNPVYATAKGYARDTALRQEAVKAGRDAGKLTMIPEEVEELRRTIAPDGTLRVPGGSEEEFRNAAATEWARRLGAGESTGPVVGGGASNVMKRPELSRRVAATFGPDAGEELARRFGLERRMAETERAIVGSRTTPLALDVAELGAGGAPSGSSVVEGIFSPARALMKAGWDNSVAPVWNRAVVGLTERRADAAGRLLLGGQNGPESLTQALQLLAARREREANALARSLRLGGLFGGGMGRVAGER